MSLVVVMATRVPADLYKRDSLVVRSRDFADRWSNPTNELTRLARAGIVRPVRPGYWLIPPADRLQDAGWRWPWPTTGLRLWL
jgi:hypothetical protein